METLVTNKKDRVLIFFLQHPTKEVHLRELARILRISFPWIRKISSILVKEGYLSKKKERGFVLIKANRGHALFQASKRSYNLFSLYKSDLVLFLTEKYQRPEAIIVFGSYSRGEDTEESDIDIAVLTKRQEEINVSLFEKKLQRKIRILELKRKDIEKEFWNTLINGIVVYGYLELP